VNRPADCPQPEHVICPLAANGWQEYRRLVLASIENFKQQLTDFSASNKAEHAEIFRVIRQRETTVDDRLRTMDTHLVEVDATVLGRRRWTNDMVAWIVAAAAVASAVTAIVV
jgi:hypothetical protein